VKELTLPNQEWEGFEDLAAGCLHRLGRSR
jgi:hypothetical protein